jgi:hypothetical protein
VNTPPSSSTPPPSSTSSPATGPGVQAPDGYKTDTGQMSSSGRNISTKAEDAKGEVDNVKPTKVQPAEFGQHTDHQNWQKDYAAAIEQLGTASVSMCDNLMSFAQQLGGTGASYTNQDTGAANTVTSAGAGT